MSSFGLKAVDPRREDQSNLCLFYYLIKISELGQSHFLDPNMLRLKNFLEKDSLISPPKYGKLTNLEEKSCDLGRSILKSKSSAQIQVASSSQERRSVNLQNFTDSVSQDGFSQANKNSSNNRKIPSKLDNERGDYQSKKKADFSLNYAYDSIILNPPISKQADAILKYLNKKNKSHLSSQLLVRKWIDDFKLIKSFPDKSDDDQSPLLKPFHSLKLEKVYFMIKKYFKSLGNANSFW